MASNSENDQSSIGKQCLELSKTMTNQGLTYELSLRIGPSFVFYTSGNPAPLPTVRRRKKSVTIQKHRRRLQFLKRKETATASTNISAFSSFSSSSSSTTSSSEDSRAAATSQMKNLDTGEKKRALKMTFKRSANGEWTSYLTSAGESTTDPLS